MLKTVMIAAAAMSQMRSLTRLNTNAALYEKCLTIRSELIAFSIIEIKTFVPDPANLVEVQSSDAVVHGLGVATFAASLTCWAG